MIINVSMENTAYTGNIHREHEPSLRLVHGNRNSIITDTVTISPEARERHEKKGDSALVRAVSAFCPGSEALVRKVEEAYDMERAEKVRRVKAILSGENGGYDTGSDAA